jgi:hypothetical protein
MAGSCHKRRTLDRPWARERSMITLLRPLLPGGLVAVVVAVVLHAGSAAAQGPPEQVFRVEYSKEAIPRGGWAVEGYVHNESRYLVSGVRLKVQVLDDSGGVTGESFGWVYGNVPSGGRGYFAVPVPRRGTDYRITVVSYTPNSIDAP